MTEEKQKAEIMIGRMPHFYPMGEPNGYEDCFSMYINQELIDSIKIVEKDGNYVPNCSWVAMRFTSKLLAKGISEYNLIDRARVKSENLIRTKCKSMPEEGIESFREVLEQSGLLEKVQEKVSA